MKHNCPKLVNNALAEHNTRLVANMLNDGDVFVATERIENRRDGKKAKAVVAAYCPFCGKKLKRVKGKF